MFPMQFSKFSKILQQLEKTSSRNEMTSIAVNLLKSLSKDEVAEAMYLMQGRVVPRFVALEFNVAGKLMIQAIAKAFETSIKNVTKSSKKVGDLGIVCEKLNKKKSSSISVIDVYNKLYKIASFGGSGSQEAKVTSIADLITSLDNLSSKYIARIIIGNLRLGLSDKTILDALSVLRTGDKSKRELLDKAYGARGDIGFIAEEVVSRGLKSIENINVEPGIPIASMNCEREETIKKILERMDGKAILQPKYDGLRAQVHFSEKEFKIANFIRKSQKEFLKSKENVRIFSRNMEDLTSMFPDVQSAMKKFKVRSIILDCEAVGLDPKTKEYIPFQETIQRKRKYDVKKVAKDIPVKLFAFDLLYINGKDMSGLALKKRLESLEKILKKSKQDVIEFAPSDVVTKEKEFKKILSKYITTGLEGVIAKDINEKYYPGKRGFEWIKFKKSAAGHLIDEVDTVALGYYRGRGARAKFGIGAILIGVLNKREGKFESIAKVGTGIKDEEWPKFKKRLDKISTDESPKNVSVSKELETDVWVSPEVVIVVEADEITKSPNHKAGFSEGKGYSLRFPRLKEFDRKDKSAKDITSVGEIKKMYKMQ
jgi:DNA ligase-1